MSQIAEKMVDVIRDLTHVAKAQHNRQQNFDFRGIDDLFNAIGPALRTHGVFILPTVQDAESVEVRNKNGNVGYRTILTVSYQFVAEDGSSVNAMGRGEAIDWSDKSISKAMQMALKYVLIQVFALPTNEPDPDGENHEIAERVEDETRAGIDQIRSSLLKWATDNKVPPQKLSVQFGEQYDKPLTQASLDELKEFHAKLQLGGTEVTSDEA